MSMARWQLTRLTWLLRPNLRRVSISLFASRRHPYDAISLHSSIPFITSTRYSFHYFFLSIPLQLSFFVGGWQRMRQDSLPISHDFFFLFSRQLNYSNGLLYYKKILFHFLHVHTLSSMNFEIHLSPSALFQSKAGKGCWIALADRKLKWVSLHNGYI